MKIQITTNPNAVESANCLLAFITDHLDNNLHMLEKVGLGVKELEEAKKFRGQLVSAFLKESKNKH